MILNFAWESIDEKFKINSIQEEIHQSKINGEKCLKFALNATREVFRMEGKKFSNKNENAFSYVIWKNQCRTNINSALYTKIDE